MLIYILAATIISSLVSLCGAFLLARKNKWSQPFALHLTALSSGVLLTTSLLHLAPEALHELGNTNGVFYGMFAGIIAFFLLERLVLWYHHHHQSHGPKPSAWLISVGDSVHNFIDGVAIASTFMFDPTLGLITTIAIGAHEIPQEIADFSIMVNAGVSKKKALLFNMYSAMASVAGALLTYFLHDYLVGYLPLLVAFSAGMFLYIALSDLIPELHHHTTNQRDKWTQLMWFFIGIALLFGVTQTLGEVAHADEAAEHQEETH